MTTLPLLCAILVLGLTWLAGLGETATTGCPIKNCQTCKATTNNALTCQSCKPGTILRPSDNTCIGCPGNCKVCKMSGAVATCDVCNDAYFRANDTCHSCTEGCKACTGRDMCETGKCETEFTAPSIRKCKDCPPKCKECDGAGKCRECNDEHYLDASFTCQACPGNCKKCKNADSCETCKDRRYWHVTARACYPCSSNCAKCTAIGCTLCDITPGNGFFLKGGKCLSCGNCKTGMCKNDTGCGECDTDYFTGIDKTCTECPLNDMDGSEAKCEACKSKNTGLGTRIYLSGKCEYCPSDCKNCTSTTDCLECNDGFYTNGTDCIKCDPSCKTCTGEGVTKCALCTDTKKFSTGSAACAACNDTCATCSGTADTCTSCIAGHYKDGTTCKPCSDAKSPDEMDAKQCTDCRGNYVYQDPCIKCTVGCRTCLEDGVTCTKCTDGYYLDITTKTCKACDAYCANGTCVGPAASDCTTCNATDEYVKSTGCVAACAANEYRKSGTCTVCSADFTTNCIECDDGGCTNCNGTDHIKGDRTGCIACEGLSKANCAAGCFWNVTSSDCAPCDSSCKECEDYDGNGYSTSSECKSCVKNKPKMNVCYTCHSNCSTCKGPNIDDCTRCHDGASLKDDKCEACTVADCVKCSHRKDECEECTNNKVLINKQCLDCETGAKELYSENYCNYCMFVATSTQYGVARSQTCAECAPNCKKCATTGAGKCDAGECANGYVDKTGNLCETAQCDAPRTQFECETECANGKVKHWQTSPDLCITCPDHCTACTAVDKCTTCEDGYILNDISQSKCVPCYGNTNSMCTKCGTSTTGRFYQSTGQKCYACIDNCLECDDATTCKVGRCEGKRYYNSVGKSCDACMSYCDKCTESANQVETCTTCSTGNYYKDSNQTCKVCPDTNCKTCTSPNGECETCVAKYYRNATKTCISCPQSNCKVCTATACTECEATRYYNSTSKKCEACPTANCQTCHITSATCITCNARHKLVNNTMCIPCPAGCEKCDNAKTCTSTKCYECDLCQTTTRTYIAATTGECIACPDSNCAVCNKSDAGVCNENGCNVGYYFHGADTKKCKACPTNCAKCTSTTAGSPLSSCTSCNTGSCLLEDTTQSPKINICELYTVGVDKAEHCKTCKKNANSKLTCLTCASPKVLEICGKCDVKDCNDCNGNKGYCDAGKCKHGFYAHNGTSGERLCSVCSLDVAVGKDCKDYCDKRDKAVWDAANLKCHKCAEKDCLKCSNKTMCETCIDGCYKTDNGKCQTCKLKCAKCTSAKECTHCVPGYGKNGAGNCEVCGVTSCVKCDGDVSKCQQCKSGYYYKSNTKLCIACPAHCTSCSEREGTCEKCEDGYYIDGKGCSSCSPAGCRECKGYPLECQTCSGAYSNKNDPKKCKKQCYTCKDCGDKTPTESQLQECTADDDVCIVTKKIEGKQNRECGKKAQGVCTASTSGCSKDSCCDGSACNKHVCKKESGAAGVRVELLWLLLGVLLTLLSRRLT